MSENIKILDNLKSYGKTVCVSLNERILTDFKDWLFKTRKSGDGTKTEKP